METTFGKYIEAIRITAGLSQNALADKIEIEKSTVSRWEAGKAYPKRNQLKKLIDLFPERREQILIAYITD